MGDGSIRTFWRKAVPERKFAEYAGTIARKYYEGKQMHLKELILTDEYKKEIAFISPINEVSLSDEELRRIIELVKMGIPDDYKKIRGLDGHSYDIWFENSKRYSLWCWVHKSLEPIAAVINLLVDRAGLDREMYGMKVQK